MLLQLDEKVGPKKIRARKLTDRPQDPFEMLSQVVNGELQLSEFDVSSLDNNFRVMEILHAAKKSAKENRTVNWDEIFKNPAINAPSIQKEQK